MGGMKGEKNVAENREKEAQERFGKRTGEK